jgi:hypothetical protein
MRRVYSCPGEEMGDGCDLVLDWIGGDFMGGGWEMGELGIDIIN